MPAFGKDFRAAKSKELYSAELKQHYLLVILMSVLLGALYIFFQTVFSIIIYRFAYFGSVKDVFDQGTSNPQVLKSGILCLGPACLLTCVSAWLVSKFVSVPGNPALPLRLPRLGYVGWVLVAIGFMIVMMLLFKITMYLLSVNPSEYSPINKGGGSKAGLVEKSLAGFSKDPWFFATALPGIALGAPFAEEFIFRGIMFAGIANSPLGKWGAIILTAGIWSVIHGVTLPPLLIFALFMMGLVLGLLLLRFGSLWVTILCHGLWNALTTVGIFVASNAQ